LSRVVFPAPRKPDSTVTGSSWGDFVDIKKMIIIFIDDCTGYTASGSPALLRGVLSLLDEDCVPRAA
jgi:hypothetical protein